MDMDDDSDAAVDLLALLDEDARMRVNDRKCGTCIYWDENRMYLAPGRKEQMEAEADAEGTFITCHQTLPASQYEAQQAVCYGYWNHAKDSNWRMRLVRFLNKVRFVRPPSTTWNKPGRKS